MQMLASLDTCCAPSSLGWGGGGARLYLQDEVSVRSQPQVQVLVVQVFSESRQELVLPADVGGQDEGA